MEDNGRRPTCLVGGGLGSEVCCALGKTSHFPYLSINANTLEQSQLTPGRGEIKPAFITHLLYA